MIINTEHAPLDTTRHLREDAAADWIQSRDREAELWDLLTGEIGLMATTSHVIVMLNSVIYEIHKTPLSRMP